MTDARSEVTILTHSKVQLALHHLRGATRPVGAVAAAPRSRRAVAATPCPTWARLAGPGRRARLHRARRLHRAPGGGYSAEILLADADAALGRARRGEAAVTVVGRGLGAYIALLLAGARAAQVRGAVLCDGPGLAGGPRADVAELRLPRRRAATPDPYALLELSRDLRPPDYATLFVRLAWRLGARRADRRRRACSARVAGRRGPTSSASSTSRSPKPSPPTPPLTDRRVAICRSGCTQSQQCRSAVGSQCARCGSSRLIVWWPSC